MRKLFGDPVLRFSFVRREPRVQRVSLSNPALLGIGFFCSLTKAKFLGVYIAFSRGEGFGWNRSRKKSKASQKRRGSFFSSKKGSWKGVDCPVLVTVYAIFHRDALDSCSFRAILWFLEQERMLLGAREGRKERR